MYMYKCIRTHLYMWALAQSLLLHLYICVPIYMNGLGKPWFWFRSHALINQIAEFRKTALYICTWRNLNLLLKEKAGFIKPSQFARCHRVQGSSLFFRLKITDSFGCTCIPLYLSCTTLLLNFIPLRLGVSLFSGHTYAYTMYTVYVHVGFYIDLAQHCLLSQLIHLSGLVDRVPVLQTENHWLKSCSKNFS